ncbi:MAG: LacI family transcriptional regulator [Oscillibacter sp.]|jgi:LacI family transcriptional regulator|nr:LacI family transcriptional regulator [Oscillibacter sp.]
MSIRKIAKMTNLSIATVSNVLNGTRPTSESSRQKVMEAAEQIGYRPNLAARMLRTQKSNTIAYIIPTDEHDRNANFFYMDVLLGIHQKLRETGYSVLVANYSAANEGERSLSALEVFKKQWVDGVIFVPSSRNRAQLDALREMKVPFVLADRQVDGDDYSSVTSDNEQGTYDAVQLLGSCGRRRIGLIGGGVQNSSGYERCRGYTRAIEALGQDTGTDLMVLVSEFSTDRGKSATRTLLERGVDGILVADNALMVGVVEELQHRQVRIPDDVGIVGYDDFDWMKFTSPPLTTVCQQAHRMGYAAAQMMMDQLAGQTENRRVKLETSLILRASHGTPEDFGG